MIYCEDEIAAKVNESLPEPAPAPAPVAKAEPAPRPAKKKAVAAIPVEKQRTSPEDEERKAKTAGRLDSTSIKPETSISPSPVDEPVVAAKREEEAPLKAPWTLDDKKEDIVRLISAREHVSFEELKKEFALNESPEEIEDYLFDLIKTRAIKGVIEDDGFSRRD